MQQPDSLKNVDTHWSRALYYDFFSAHGEDKETFVATDRSSRDGGARRGGSPVNTASTTRLAIFIAVYTAVAFAVHFLFWPDAAASGPDSPPATESAAASPNSSPGAGQWSAGGKPSTAAESMFLYD